MNDYLSHLVARQFNPTTTPQPRPASLFEPPPVAGDVFSEVTSLVNQTAEVGKVEAGRPPQPLFHSPLESPPTIRPPLEPFYPPGPSDLTPRPAAKKVKIRAALQPHYEPELATRATRPAEPFSVHPIQPSPPQPHPPVSPIIPPSPPDPSVPHQSPLTQEITVELLAGRPAQFQPLVNQAEPNHSPQGVVLTPRSEPARPQPSLKPVSVRPGVHPPVINAATEPVEPPAPTIQVTIGRIEIRATPASTAPLKKSPPPSPVMSLDEYLRRRAGGGSR